MLDNARGGSLNESAPDPNDALAAILHPVTEREFLFRHLGKAFVHIRGKPGRFEELLPWQELNRVLAQHRLDDPRIRVAKEGKIIPASAFLSYARPRQFERMPTINAEALSALLRGGATLVVEKMDEVYEPLTILAEKLERKLGVRIQANAYAAWHCSRGFDVHWDDHDALILQVYGRKDWKLYGTTRRFPLGRDISPNVNAPTDPVWEGELQPGDLLYIPRGEWHVALPKNEPTLHVTLGFERHTGINLAEWFVGQLRGFDVFREDLPRFADLEARHSHAAKLRSVLDAMWSSNIVADYLAYADSIASGRPKFSLPLSGMTDPFVGNLAGVRVRLYSARTCVVSEESEGMIRLEAHGRKWGFDARLASVLRLLAKGGEHSVAEICLLGAVSISNDEVLNCLRALLDGGLLVATLGDTPILVPSA
jgi:ribosomal protein L16 Arg81 hydroxylase